MLYDCKHIDNTIYSYTEASKRLLVAQSRIEAAEQRLKEAEACS